MVTPISLQTQASLPAQAFYKVKAIAQKVIDFVYAIFRWVVDTITNLPSLARKYIFFQVSEIWLPAPLKAAVYSCHAYIHELFAKWKQEDLQGEISELTREKKRLEQMYRECTHQVGQLQASLVSLIEVGQCDRKIQDQLTAQVSAVQAAWHAVSQVSNLRSEELQNYRSMIENLQSQINTLKTLTQIGPIHCAAPLELTEEEKIRLTKLGIFVGSPL